MAEQPGRPILDRTMLNKWCSMRMIVFLCLFALVGCQAAASRAPLVSSPSASNARPAAAGPRSGGALEFSQQCPHLCWVGINPGVTTAHDADAILRASNQIDQTTLTTSETKVSGDWHADSAQPMEAGFTIALEGERVKTIALGDPPSKLMDVVNLIGEPTEISFTLMREAEGTETLYSVYFARQRVQIVVFPGGWLGPEPDHHIAQLWLNVDFTSGTLPSWWGPIQPWRGYGHINEYLPGVDVPPADAIPTWAP